MAEPLPNTVSFSRTARLALGGGLLGIVALLIGLEYLANSYTLSVEWEARSVRLTRLLATAVEPAFKAGDPTSLNRIVAEAAQAPELRAVTVVDQNGMILADSAGRARGDQSNIPVPILRQALAGGSRHLRWTEARSGETVQYFLTPLQDTTAPPGASPSVLAPPAQGALLVALDLHPLEMLKTKTFRHLVAVNGAGFVLLVFLLWLLLTRTTTRPLTTFLRKVVETSGPSMTPGGLAGRRDLQETLTNLTKAVQDREAFHRAVLTSLPAQLAVLDREGRILSVNPSWDTQARDMATPFPSPATVGSNYLTACRLAPPDYAEHAREALLGVQAVLDGSLRQFTMEFPCHAKAGERWYLLCATPLAQSSGGAVISYTDITERKQVEAALRESLAEAQLARERLDSLYKTAPIGMMYVTPDLKIERVNQFLADVHRRTGPEHLGRPLSDIIPPERWSVLAPVFEEVLGTGIPRYAFEEELPDPYTAGHTRYYHTEFHPDLSKEGAILGVHVVMQDITEQKLALLQQEQYLRELEAKNRELDQIAIRDPLTGLYNRRFFDEGLNREWQRFQRSGEAFTVIILDVDHLKKINDLYGHESGDHALQQVGAMLQMSLRETDMVARVGGDEFAALLPRTDAGSAQAVMTKLQESAKKLRLVSVPRPIPITVSLGASTVPGFPPVSSPAELLRVADKRMYEAKRLTSSRQTDTR